MPKPNWAHLVMMSEAKIQLGIEIAQHQELIRDLALVPDADFAEMLAYIAAHCEIAVHGAYTEEDIDKLCDLLTAKLKQKRSLVIATTSARMVVPSSNKLH